MLDSNKDSLKLEAMKRIIGVCAIKKITFVCNDNHRFVTVYSKVYPNKNK